MIIAIVLTIIYALWEAKGDYDDIEGGVFINHVQRWLTRATIAGVFGEAGVYVFIAALVALPIVHRKLGAASRISGR